MYSVYIRWTLSDEEHKIQRTEDWYHYKDSINVEDFLELCKSSSYGEYLDFLDEWFVR